MKPSTVLLRTKLKPVKDTLNYAEPKGRVCAIGALLVGAGYTWDTESETESLRKNGRRVSAIYTSLVARKYKIPEVVAGRVVAKFHQTKDLKAVGRWLKERGY